MSANTLRVAKNVPGPHAVRIRPGDILTIDVVHYEKQPFEEREGEDHWTIALYLDPQWVVCGDGCPNPHVSRLITIGAWGNAKQEVVLRGNVYIFGSSWTHTEAMVEAERLRALLTDNVKEWAEVRVSMGEETVIHRIAIPVGARVSYRTTSLLQGSTDHVDEGHTGLESDRDPC